MNADIVDIAEYLENNTVDGLLSKAIDTGDVEGAIVDLNTREQLGKFEDSEGRKLADIGGEYSQRTQLEKGLGPREINLNDEGDYWESFEANPIKGGYEVDSDPIKDGQNLEDRWGNNLEGTNEVNTEKASEIIEDKIWSQAQESL